MESIKLMDKKKILIFLGLIIAIDLVVAFGITKLLTHKSEADVPEPDSAESVDIAEVDTSAELNEIYSLLLVGHFKLDDDIAFNFESDGTYSGFFDSKNRSVEGYSYKLASEDGQAVVHIYNEDKSREVTYIMSLSEEGNIILSLPNSDDKLELKY